MNDLEKYYIHQAGSGLAGFRGIRYQRGRGFFGRLLSGAVYPLLRFLGKNLLRTGENVATDVLDSDDFSFQNLKDVTKKNLQSRAKDVLGETLTNMKGSGKRKRYY